MNGERRSTAPGAGGPAADPPAVQRDGGDGTPVTVLALGDDPEALKRTVEVLVRRIERTEVPAPVESFTAMQVLSSLEGVLEERTRALGRSEARYRTMFQASPHLLLTVDVHGNITDANRTATQFLRCQVADLVGTPLQDLFYQPNGEQVWEVVARGFVGAVSRQVVLRDGRRVLFSAAPVPGYAGEGQVILQEVTAREVLEAELQHSRRLAAIGHLSAGVAHEINNPLAVMQGRIELLATSPLTDAEQVRRQLTLIAEHGRRIARIVQNLQTYARPHPIVRETFPVSDVVQAAQEITGKALDRVQVSVRVEPPDLLLAADRGQAEQVLVNLLVNAADAVRRTGSIQVRARRAGTMVEFEVEDDGPGIPRELLDVLFSPFVSSKAPGKGSGLGLSIAWGIVTDHGGTLQARNVAGGGACFQFTLPLGTGTAGSILADDPPLEGYQLRVLCVDDEPFLLQTVQALAEAAGHQVRIAATAEEALRLIEEHDFDVVLADIRLSGMTGVELKEALELRDPVLARRTVIMSGLPQVPPRGILYLQKPFSRKQLLAVLEQASRA